MENEETFELFDSEVEALPFKIFTELHAFGVLKNMGKLTDNQKKVLEKVSDNISYSNIQRDLDMNNVGSVQSAIKGGIKNIIDALQDIVWLYKNPQVMELLKSEEYLGKHVK